MCRIIETNNSTDCRRDAMSRHEPAGADMKIVEGVVVVVAVVSRSNYPNSFNTTRGDVSIGYVDNIRIWLTSEQDAREEGSRLVEVGTFKANNTI